MQKPLIASIAVSSALLLAGGCAQTGTGAASASANAPSGPPSSRTITKLPKQDEARIAPVIEKLSPPEQEAFKRLYREGERNAVLNYNELGIAALEAGNYPAAQSAFDESLRRIEAIYANDANAKKAKSLFAEEKAKDFKGEPYERAMAYYYRGLLYLRGGDYQNARASFLAADYQDTVAEKEEFQGDFGLMNYLAAWASACDGDAGKAKDLFEAGAAKDAAINALSPDLAMLYIVEAGRGPVKVGAGKYKELLTFASAGGGGDELLGMAAPGSDLSPWVKVADLQYQASTRGGRPVQGILNGKAQFKDTTDKVGTTAMTAGMVTSSMGIMNGNSDMAQLGSYAALAGSLFMMASAMTTPAADTRQWVTLPRDIYLSGGKLVPTEPGTPEVSYRSEAGAEGKVAMQHWGKQGRCAVAWGRTRTGLLLQDVRPVQAGKQPRDEILRTDLLETFAPRGGQS